MDQFSEAIAVSALRASRAILDVYDTDFDVDIKSDNSLVTKADKLAEEIILADLERIAPEIPVIAEESAAA